MSILDAMGYGLPVVSTNVGGIPKIVHNGENGYCFEVGDTDGMSKSLSDFILDDTRRKNAAKSSFCIVMAKYSLEEHIGRVEKLYERQTKKREE